MQKARQGDNVVLLTVHSPVHNQPDCHKDKERWERAAPGTGLPPQKCPQLFSCHVTQHNAIQYSIVKHYGRFFEFLNIS